jgi:hypothetical protein
MSKNIVVFSDGTGQDGGVRAEQRLSNIYKLYRACRIGPDSPIDPAKQISFYDPGLGTETTAAGLTPIVRRTQKMLASVAGNGITTNIADCYEFIINHYEPGDRIFLFGFSRGAYTVRALANLLMLCGIPTDAAEHPVPRFRKATRDIAEEAVHDVLEHGAGHPREAFEEERLELARRYRAKYGSDHQSGETNRSNAAPYFIGVFDTVAALGATGLRRTALQAALVFSALALGVAIALVPAILIAAIASIWYSFWIFFALVLALGAAAGVMVLGHRQRRQLKKTIADFPKVGDKNSHYAEWKGEHFDRLLSIHVPYARSANAIDETRKDFARVPWGPTKAAPERVDGHIRFKQLWFAGNHSDVGGSYPETESRLSDIALHWMIEEAVRLPEGLIVGPVQVNGAHLTGTLAEGPKLHLFPDAGGVQHCEVAATKDVIAWRIPPRLHRWTGSLGYQVKLRDIDPRAVVHPTVLERFALEKARQCTGTGPYRPEALRSHESFATYYFSPETQGDDASAQA